MKTIAVDGLSVTVDGKTVNFAQAVKNGWIADHIYGYVDKQWYVTSVFESAAVLPPWRGVYLLLAKDVVLRLSPL